MGGLRGAVTFLFTDIEGSTRLVKALRERYPLVLAEHLRLVRAAVAAHGGREVDTQGDAFFAVFGGAAQAVACALEVQRALAAHAWPEGVRVRVRMGIHSGQAVLAGEGYTGLAVHRAARICAAARGGQVLVSQATQTLIEDEEEGQELGFTLVDAGEHRLKGLDRPVRLFQLAAAGLDAPAPCGGQRAAGLAVVGEAAGVRGFAPALTSFVGRAGAVRDVASLLVGHRLVTVLGPGGSGKTRLAGAVAQQVAGRFADGVWLAELAPVADAAQVPSVVAAALGIREQRGVPAAESVARVLSRQQLLLVLDNCEHVIGAAAELCAGLLVAADDLRILATSREGLRVAGEARFRLGPLAVPDTDDLADAATAEAVVLFTDRARTADRHFTLTAETAPAVARLVARLDGMPLAIELAAARVEALGVTQLVDRLDDRFAVITGGDRLALSRHQSLAATVEWSYRLLDEPERRAFRAVSVFPGPFTLEGAEAVAGTGAGLSVLRLVDCSLLGPPHAGADGQPRYVMLETLRTYGSRLQAEAGEQDTAAAALAGYALRVAEQAAAGLQTSAGEAAAARRLDAEEPTMRQALAWAIAHDADIGLRLGAALAPWWFLRGRLAGQYPVLGEAVAHAAPGGDGWSAAQFWLGTAMLSSADLAGALGVFTAVRDAIGARGPSRALADCLASRSVALSNLGRLAEAVDDGRRALAVAGELGYPAGEALAQEGLSIAAYYSGDLDGSVRLARRAEQIQADIPGWIARFCSTFLAEVLDASGDLAEAERVSAAGLAWSRDVGDLRNLAALLIRMAMLEMRSGRTTGATAHLREALQISAGTGGWLDLANGLACCGYLCAATQRWADSVTAWAASAALLPYEGSANAPSAVRRRQELLVEARQVLGPAQARSAEDRGAAMSCATAAEYALLLTAPAPGPLAAATSTGLGRLSARERELVTLVAKGRTNAQIAAQLHTSVRSVSSHLDRIRDKTGCRRRADLTRLALTEGLI